MGHSSLLGTEPAATEPRGRDTASLGPSDSSDSGSDLAGLDERSGGDPAVPVDVALRGDTEHPLLSRDTLNAQGSDTAGTGERRGAADDHQREAADIGVDRIVTPHREAGDDDVVDEGDVVIDDDPLDDIAGSPTSDPLDEELDDDT